MGDDKGKDTIDDYGDAGDDYYGYYDDGDDYYGYYNDDGYYDDGSESGRTMKKNIYLTKIPSYCIRLILN